MTSLIEVKQTLLLQGHSGSTWLLRSRSVLATIHDITLVTVRASKKQPSTRPVHLRYVDEEGDEE